MVDAMKRAMGLFPTGVAVITGCDNDVPVGFSCQTLVSLSLDPPLVSFCVSKRSRSWPKIERHGAFGANILADGQDVICHQFSKPVADRFSGVDWTLEEPQVPMIGGCLAFIGAKIESTYEGGDHYIVVGRVVRVKAFEGHPLLYFGSRFARLHTYCA